MALAAVEVTPYILSLFESACFKLFERMDCSIRKLPSETKKPEWPGSMIEAASSELRVTLLLRMPQELIEQTMPPIDGAGMSEAALNTDWLAELSNQALGRLKNKLMDHGCTLTMGLPRPCQEAEVSEFENRPGEKFVMNFEVEDKSIECNLSIMKINRNVQINEYEDEDEDWFDESELQNL